VVADVMFIDSITTVTLYNKAENKVMALRFTVIIDVHLDAK